MPFVNVYRTVTMNLNKRSKNRIWAKVDTKVEKRLEWNKRNRKPEQPNLLKPLWFSFPTFLRSHRLPVFSWQGFIKALVFFWLRKKSHVLRPKKQRIEKLSQSTDWRLFIIALMCILAFIEILRDSSLKVFNEYKYN